MEIFNSDLIGFCMVGLRDVTDEDKAQVGVYWPPWERDQEAKEVRC